MSVGLQCSCGARSHVSAEELGGKYPCPACGRVLDLPTAEECARQLGESPFGIDASTAVTGDSPAPPTYSLAAPYQIGLAGFLGGPLAGFLLMARNYAKRGQLAACGAMVAVGGLAMTALAAALIALPDVDHGARMGVAVPLWIGTYLAAKLLQGRTFARHQNRGGEQASGQVVLGFILLGIALTFGIAVGAAAVFEFGLGDHRLRVNNVEEIYYGRDITEAQARSLAGVLQDNGLFDGTSEKSVGLRKERNEYVLSIILLSGFEDSEVHKEFQEIAARISKAFGGEPVRIDLCDSWETPKKRLPVVRER